MDTPIAPVAPVPAQQAVQPAAKQRPVSAKSPAARLRGEAEKCRAERDKMVEGVWKQNVEYRRGKPYKADSDEHRVSVPVDWSFTKSKEAGLFSQVPAVILVPKHDKYKPAIPVMQKELNDVLTDQVKVGVAMEEVLADEINASGLAGVMCGYIATFVDEQIPSNSPEMFSDIFPGATLEQLVKMGAIKMLPNKKRVDCRFYATRLSPSQLLWPLKFKGSDFDDADWVGYDGTCTWAQALREFAKDEKRPNGLTPEMKDRVCGGATKESTLSPDADGTEQTEGDEQVSYTRLFYWAARQDPDEVHLEKIREVVYISGIDEPVVDEDLRWQEWDEASESFIGLTKFPLRIGTLTYISDMPVPPSDSEMGRPQVDEKMRSRSQMILQRDRATPMRGVNVNRVDPMILANIMKGDYQGIIPVNGDPQSAFAEVARANYPSENWDFDRVQEKDLMDSWQVGPNQTGSFNTSGRTAAEANIVQSGFATRQAKERAKVGKFFCGIAETILGLMQLYYDGPKEKALVGDDGLQRMGVWDRKTVSAVKFVCTIREDSSVKLDSQQQIEKLIKFLNIAAKSGFLNVKHIIEELALLTGLDPAKAVVQPNPKAPEPPNVSLRAGGEDLSNPIIGPYLIALMQKGHPVEATDIEAAKALLIAASSPPEPPQPAPAPGQPPAPGGPIAPGGAPQPPKDYGPIDRVTKRTDEVGG